MRVTLTHAGGLMRVDLSNAARSKAYGLSFRGKQSVSITAGPAGGKEGGYGAISLVASKVVEMRGANAVPDDRYVLGTSAIYTCTSSQLHIRFFDNADVSAPATFGRL